MIGFELTIRDEKISAALRDGVFSVILTKVSNDILDTIELDLSGLNTSDSESYETIEWYKSSLGIGDEIVIKVREINDISTPVKVVNHSIESINTQSLKAYYELKRDLEEKGLI